MVGYKYVQLSLWLIAVVQLDVYWLLNILSDEFIY